MISQPMWEPIIVDHGKCIQFKCREDGWEGTKLRPDQKGNFVRLCREAQLHWNEEHSVVAWIRQEMRRMLHDEEERAFNQEWGVYEAVHTETPPSEGGEGP